MDINSVVYLPDMPAAGALGDIDALHLSQGNIDFRLTIAALTATFNASMHPIGSLISFGNRSGQGAINKNPNTLFPGQTWIRFNAGKSLRSASNDGDVGNNLGGDQFFLTTVQMPAHSHTANNLGIGAAGDHYHTGGTTTNGNHGHNAWTDGQGAHAHQYNVTRGGDGGNGSDGGVLYAEIGKGWNWTTTNGQHSHNIGMNGAGAHSHTISTDGGNSLHSHKLNGTTANAGNGQAITTVPLTTHIACWLRTA